MNTIERTCICCRKTQDKRNMLRIVKNKEGQVFVDPTHKANGRGAYICSDPQCIKKSQKSNVLSNALKTQIPPEVFEQILEHTK